MLDYVVPIIWCMRVFGLYHINPSEGRTGIWKVVNTRTYCLIITILLWLNLLRYIPVFWMGMTLLRPFEVMSFFWFLQGALNASFCFRACALEDHLPRFHKLWRLYVFDIETKDMNLICSKKYMRNWCIGWLVFCWTFIVSNTLIYVGGILGAFPRGALILQTYVDPFPHTILNYTIYLFVEIFLAAAWIFPFSFVIVCTLGMRKIADNFDKYIEAEVEECQKKWPWNDDDADTTENGHELEQDPEKAAFHKAPPDINMWRFHHLRLCDLVKAIDVDFRVIILGFSVVSIPKACYITFRLIHHVSTRYESTFNLLNIYWLIFTVFNATCILVCAFRLNDELYSPMKYIPRLFGHYGEGMDKLNLQIQLFVLRLKGTGEQMGFTIGGLVVISKGLILTMFGIYVTFVFLIIEFEFEVLM